MKRAIVLGLAAAVTAVSAGSAGAVGPSQLPPAWHIHDCAPGSTCTFPHAAAGFFPAILTGGNLAAYLQDPARCPDATDKSLLGGGAPGPTADGLNGNQPLREGICMTNTTIIHLKSIAADQPAPNGWTLASTSGGFSTYYELTPA
jgi:hypothetical protein